MKLMTFLYIGIAVVFLATIIIMLLQKYSPTKGKRQTRRGIIALACWGLGIALIFFGTEHYMASAASIVIAAAIIVIILRSIGKMTEGMSPEEAEATLIESQNDSYNSVFAGCDSVEKREDGYHYELTVIWTSGEGYEQHYNYRHGTMHLTSNEDYLIQGRVYYLNTEALAARGLSKEECLREGGLDITGIIPGAFTDGGTVGATVMNLALRAYEGPQSETEARIINNVRNGKLIFIGVMCILISIGALISSLVNLSFMNNAVDAVNTALKNSSKTIKAQVTDTKLAEDKEYTSLILEYSYNGKTHKSSYDVKSNDVGTYGDVVYITVKSSDPSKITSIGTSGGNSGFKSYNRFKGVRTAFTFVICGVFFVVGITLAVKGFRAKGN